MVMVIVMLFVLFVRLLTRDSSVVLIVHNSIFLRCHKDTFGGCVHTGRKWIFLLKCQTVLWCVGGSGGHGKIDGITMSTTNAGAKYPTFYKWTKKSHLAEMDFLFHLDLVHMILTA